MQHELTFLPGLLNMVLLFGALAIIMSCIEAIDSFLTIRRRRKRESASNFVLESKRHEHQEREYLNQLELDVREHGIPIDSGFLASLSGDEYVS